VQAARENLERNPGVTGVTFDVADLVRLKPDPTSGELALKPDPTSGELGLKPDPASGELGLKPDPTSEALRLRPDPTSGAAVAHVVTANLTGALLLREARRLLGAVAPGGHLIVSGLLDEEEPGVTAAFAAAPVVWRRTEGEWAGLMFRVNPGPGNAV
jgi:ribosomal protein L11 methylase PrmA